VLRRIFGSSDVSPETRERIIAYFQALHGLNARQDDEAAHYNDALVMHGAGIAPGSDASRVVAEAAARMAATNRTLLKEHGDWGPIPDEAGTCYMTWHSTYLALVAWSDAAAAAYRSISEGGTPIVGRVGQLLQEEERWKDKALKTEGALMKRIKLTADEARRLLT